MLPMQMMPGTSCGPGMKNLAQSLRFCSSKLGVQFKCSDCLVTTATQLHDIMDYIYAIGILQQDNFLLIFLMNVLSAKFLSLCNHITDCINASSATKPYTSTRALQWLNMEQQILNGEKQHQGGSFALAATIPNAKPYQKSNHKCGICSQLGHDTCCMNCGSTRHPKDQCWQPGGG